MKFPTDSSETLAEAIDWSPLCLPDHLTAEEAITLWRDHGQRRSDYTVGALAPIPWALVLDKKNQLIGLLPDWQLAAALWTEHFSPEIKLNELCLSFPNFLKFPTLPSFTKVINLFEQHSWDILPVYHGQEKAWGILSIGNIVRQVDLCQLWQNLSLQTIVTPSLYLSLNTTVKELIYHGFEQQASTFPILYSSPLLPPYTTKVPLGNVNLDYYLKNFLHDSLLLESQVGDKISTTFSLCIKEQNYYQAREILIQQNHDYVIVTQTNGEFAGWVTPRQWLQTFQPDVLLEALQKEVKVPVLVGNLEARIVWQQRQLQRNQHLIQKLLNHNPNLIYLYDLVHHEIIYLNYTLSMAVSDSNEEKILNYSMVSQELQHPLLPLEYFTLESLISLQPHEKKEFAVELTDSRRSPHYFKVEISAFEVDSKGKTSKLLCIARDITKGKQAEVALHRREKQLSTLVNTVADGIVILNSSNTVIYANPVACGMFGITQEEFLQSQLGLSGKNQTEISINLAEEEGIGEIKSVPIHWEGQECNLVTVRDVTDRQRALQKLQDSEKRYRSLLETLPNLVWKLSPTGEVWECNRRTLSYFGKKRRHIIGDGWQKFINPREIDTAQQDWQKGLDRGIFFRLECRLRRADGQYRWQLIQVLPLGDKFGEIDSWLASSTDIDDLKQAQETLRNQAQQEKLLSSISQRIRESLKLETILQTTVKEVRRTIQADRVLIYCIEQNGLGKTVAESVTDDHPSVMNMDFSPERFPPECHQRYLNGYIYASGQQLPECAFNCSVQCFTVAESQSRMVAPIVFDRHLWGLLIVHQCSEPRDWQTTEIQLIKSLGNQLAIAIQQSLLYERLQSELSERKKTEQKLLEANQLQKGIFDVANYIIISMENDGTISTFNRTAEELLGYSTEEVIGRYTPFQFHDAREIEMKAKELSQELNKTIAPNSLDLFAIPAQHWGVYESEWTYITKNGDRLPVHLSITALRDSQGEVDGLVAVASDLRRQKQIEMERQNLDFVVKNSTELIVIADLDQKVNFLNEAGQKLVGLESLEVAQKTYLTEYITPEYFSFWQVEIIPKVMRAGAWEGEFSLKHYQTGEEIPVTASLFLLYGGDRQHDSSLVAIMHDITHIKNAEKKILAALEKEKELSELRSRFIATTSHEFRTPLAIISSSMGIIKKYWEKLGKDKRNQHLDRIQESVDHMVELLDDVLTMNRTEAKEQDFTPQAQNLLAFCKGIIDELQSSTDNHCLLFTHEAIEEEETVLLDSKLVRQILTNLLGNAIKYSPNSSEVNFHVQRHGQDAVFTVQDRGIGIPADNLPKLFDSFYRADNVGTIAGTGLGLPIVKKSVDLHGGTITVTSKLGQGSCFRVSLPLWPGEEIIAVVPPDC